MHRLAELGRSLPALMIALVVLLPVISVLVLSLDPGDHASSGYANPAIRRYALNTLILVTGVALLAGMTGVLTAWAVVFHDFPFRRALEVMLFLPLALPAYVGAYALVDFLEYAGPVQTMLRATLGWSSAQEYYFPEVRSIGGATVVLAASLYPYVYLLTRVSLHEQSSSSLEVASTLGIGPFGRFLRVGLPLVRPGIVAGLALVMMETVADFGVADYFAVQTLTTRMFSIWFQGYDIVAAARVATLILACVALILILERVLRKRSRYHQASSRGMQYLRRRSGRFAGILIAIACLIPVCIGFMLPVGVLLGHAIGNSEQWMSPGLGRSLFNSVFTAGAASVITVILALLMVYWTHLVPGRLPSMLLPLTSLGYAAPGIVIGIGVLIPVTYIDHTIADLVERLFRVDLGMLMTGSAGAVVLAYTIRFFAIAQGATESALGRVSPSVNLVARTLGRTASGTLLSVELPMIRGSLLTAAVLVFVDCVKELPATLLLKPFNFNTLATRVYEHASLENLAGAAPAALLVTLVGATGIFALMHTSRVLDW